ncbi:MULTISPECIES: D-hexose-6-phosphate mutarotase [unclassified Marichromatium]|uniref:D-hexose-6-phosphate mutarotase n=1 Tax=unclassified Marichromatium TaxID=2618417 RepID=UPI00167FFBA3|nr:D-hexose-6-phosphate mutarotase [Marichromatium sp. AB31]
MGEVGEAVCAGVRLVATAAGDLLARIETPLAEALVSVRRAQVLAYRPRGCAEDLLFVGSRAAFRPGRERMGGVPLCWPWFGVDPDGGPIHGFARTADWRLLDCAPQSDGAVRLRLVPESGALAAWPHPCALLLEIRVGATLGLTLETRNEADHPWTLTQGLHTYLRVGASDRVRLHGLDGRCYLDKARGAPVAPCRQQGPVSAGGEEVNRIYLDAPGPLWLDDPVLGRRIRVRARGSRTWVVWNPGATEIHRFADDLAPEDARRFLCVETVNTASETLNLAPGAASRIGADYQIETL